jgi:UDP-N-acetylmuramoylalanine--D-glutamate ligase
VGGVHLVVTSPGWRPTSPLLVAAQDAGVPVWGEPELAWRLRRPDDAPWLAVTGTNGKTTTTLMLAAMLTAGGKRTIAAGNIGTPLVDIVMADERYDVLAVEIGSFQLHWSPSIVPAAATVLNVAPDHLDWHGGLEEYAAAKARAFADPQTVAVGNADDLGSLRLLARAPGRRVSVTLASPRPGQLGLVEDLLVDRAFVDDPQHEAVEIATLSDIPLAGGHNVINALAAAALARSYGVAPEAVAEGLRSFTPAKHRNALVATIDEVAFVDDSKATNPHAAAASLGAYKSIVWIAGGLGKDTPFDELIIEAAPRLRGAVLLGSCRGDIREALSRHAPNVPVVELHPSDTEDMDSFCDHLVAEAANLATRGDTVLLAPAAASMDMFVDYADRGERFSAAVLRRAHAVRAV